MKRKPIRRRGNILILSALLMIMMLAFMAFAVDVGSIAVTRNELQRCADAAALAGCWELIDAGRLTGTSTPSSISENAKDTAAEFAGLNPVLRSAPSLPDADINVGYLSDPMNPLEEISHPLGIMPNVVQVTIKRSATTNGQVPLFFAKALGMQNMTAEAQATAAVIYNLGGFNTPSDNSSIGILPFALDEVTWNNLLAGGGTDSYAFSACGVHGGGDGIREVNLYPQGTGSPGNRGTVDIGSNNNSTADIARQIVYGVSPDDLAHHGGSLAFDATGKMYLNGDTGISAGVKDELASIIGQTRVIPIFRSVSGPGNNATYTIVKFVGVRIMNVKLTGSMSGKNVMVQPANVVVKGGRQGTATTGSDFVYSPVWLVR